MPGLEIPDLTNLTFLQVGTYAALIAGSDVLFNVILSIVHRDFSAAYVADFIRTHILLRVSALMLGAIFAHGIPALGIPTIPAVNLLVTGGLAAYLAETVWSIVQGFRETTPVPEPPTPTPAG